METYQNYKGYGISYSSFTENTAVCHFGTVLKIFFGLGEESGRLKAIQFIDGLKAK